MSNDLGTQLRDYFEFVDETLPTITADDLYDTEPLRPTARPLLRGWRIAPVAAAITVLVVLVAIFLAGRLGGDEEIIEPIGPPVVTTIPEPTTPPSTVVTTTTATEESAPQQAVTWTRLPDLAVFAGESISDVTFGNDGFVAVGSAAWHSPDGSTWSRVADFTAGDVSHGPSGYVAVGSIENEEAGEVVGEVWRSADGVTWSEAVTLVEELGVDRLVVTHGDAGYVAVGTVCCVNDESFVAFWVSSDGVEWERVDAPTFNAQHIYISDVAFGDGRYVAVGSSPGSGGTDDGVILVSTDGLTWTKIDDPALSDQRGESFQWVAGVAHGNAGWVVVGEDLVETELFVIDGAVWHSPTGDSWTRVPHDPILFTPPGVEGTDLGELELRGVIAGDAGYIAVGYEDPETGAASAVALHSEDGVTWERIDAASELFDGFQAESIAFGGGIYVAVGFNFDDGTPGAVWIGTPSS